MAGEAVVGIVINHSHRKICSRNHIDLDQYAGAGHNTPFLCKRGIVCDYA